MLKFPTLTTVACVLFAGYLMNAVYSIYSLWMPPPCPDKKQCFQSVINEKRDYEVILCSTTRRDVQGPLDLSLLHRWTSFDVFTEQDIRFNVSLPESTRKNGTLYFHAFLLPLSPHQDGKNSWKRALEAARDSASHTTTPMTLYHVPEAQTFQLVGEKEPAVKKKKSNAALPVSHLKSEIHLNIMTEPVPLPHHGLPADLIQYLQLADRNRKYLPILTVDRLRTRHKHLVQIKEDVPELEMSVFYWPVSFGRLRVWKQFENGLIAMKDLGFTDKDLDEVKGIFDINPFFLFLTMFVSTCHLLFDFLAFKNDILFWHYKKTMVGLSIGTAIWRCVSQAIIFLYLLDEATSLLVLVPTGIGTVIEGWKVSKATKVRWILWKGVIPIPSRPVKEERPTEQEIESAGIDHQGMKYLMVALIPLVVGYAVYSLLYVPHKSWYSWFIQTLVGFVYAFGFLFMFPQLFLNYKLKSVAHLPWRAFMYKAFNTFIDDLFAFIITMPTLHRMACFRDDVVFLIYLYQRYLYPVDRTRVNEYGDSYDEIVEDDAGESKKTK
ncbi:unnamed protein product [Cyprideis torosa]|uniref:Lipid scramblase CLPTM1L n=1 Tax=Cyprideis torosa TaxID=163714 RepID=A0A7R8ZGV3_9CRUS|nr:unnamed protein product [Cyprideis torosa]CAG0882256.1 unnamed protein product [Cyprideis torosa]